MFKVGSRVWHTYYGGGVIKESDSSPIPYFVEFDKPHENLHSGGYDGVFGKEKSCFWLDADNLTAGGSRFKGNK